MTIMTVISHFGVVVCLITFGFVFVSARRNDQRERGNR